MTNNIFIEESYYEGELLTKRNSFHENSDKPIKVEVFKYDQFENVIEDSTYFVVMDMTATQYYKYSLDNNNNWVTQVKKENNGSLVVTEREIEYFE